MADIKLKVSRDRLAQFIKDPETLKQFERLINYMNELVPQDQTDLAVEVQEIEATVNEAIGKIGETEKSIEDVKQSIPAGNPEISDLIKLISSVYQMIPIVEPGLHELKKLIEEIRQEQSANNSALYELTKRVDYLEQL